MVKGEGRKGGKEERKKGNRRRETGEGKRETGTGDKKGNGKQINTQTIHLNAPPPQNWIGATTIHLNAKKGIDYKGFNF